MGIGFFFRFLRGGVWGWFKVRLSVFGFLVIFGYVFRGVFYREVCKGGYGSIS